eukprot:CAMPEP_0115723268 /NCGR_PEP_ID=MMETSP0272-20121206/80143_1 /TAXON_ID=71861 /ORGANISM="Scrippsiella trochoidea, Strain CCMP3099" /LENGTH=53 /DNA_ID=CAMNT_0003166391 /DNA_START=24 /DNA_END=182 /DNA_ORIENTATION=+
MVCLQSSATRAVRRLRPGTVALATSASQSRAGSSGSAAGKRSWVEHPADSDFP